MIKDKSLGVIVLHCSSSGRYPPDLYSAINVRVAWEEQEGHFSKLLLSFCNEDSWSHPFQIRVIMAIKLHNDFIK